MSKRIEWIDSARGIAILFVVLGHCIGNIEDPVNKFILAFHMPLFFFLSGLCAKCKGDNKIKQILNKAKVLLVPQVTLGLLNCATQIVSGGGKKNNYIKTLQRGFCWYCFI